MSLTIQKIEEIYASDYLLERYQGIVSIILLSVNDWPNSLDSLHEFKEAIYSFVSENSNKEMLSNFISKISIIKNAWIVESFTQLLDIYHYYDDETTISEIFSDIEKIFIKLNECYKIS